MEKAKAPSFQFLNLQVTDQSFFLFQTSANKTMSQKVSSGSAKKGPPKHSNHVQGAFKVNPHSFIAQKIAATPTFNLCAKCLDVINWRKRMGKYKPLTVPKRCISCSEKTVKGAYHVLCQPCTVLKKCCAKCQLVVEAVETEGSNNDVKKFDTNGMSERIRRTFMRKLENEDFEGCREMITKQEMMQESEDDEDYDE